MLTISFRPRICHAPERRAEADVKARRSIVHRRVARAHDPSGHAAHLWNQRFVVQWQRASALWAERSSHNSQAHKLLATVGGTTAAYLKDLTTVKALAFLSIVAWLVTSAGCSRPPTEAERRAVQARYDEIAEKAQSDEREKEQRARNDAILAAKLAAQAVDEDRAPLLAGAIPGRPTLPVTGAPTRPDTGAADAAIELATGRIKRTLADPESIQVRNAETRDNESVVCLEFNAKSKFGEYVGFRPAIVTPDKILLYVDAKDAKGLDQINMSIEFLGLNRRLQCWKVS